MESFKNQFLNTSDKPDKIEGTVESLNKIGGDGSSFESDKDNGKMGFINWQVLLINISEIFSNPDFIRSLEDGKYNLLIADDTSARVPALIFNKVIKEVYGKKGFPNPKVIFIPGQMKSTDPNVSIKISNHINKYLENIGLLNTKINSLVITDVIAEGRTIKKLSDALEKSNINFDIVTLGLNLGDNEKRQQLENSIGKKIYTTSEAQSGTFGTPYSQGVKKYPDEMVSQKIPGVQNHINQARQMADKISERIIEEVNNEKAPIFGDDQISKSLEFVEQYWD